MTRRIASTKCGLRANSDRSVAPVTNTHTAGARRKKISTTRSGFTFLQIVGLDAISAGVSLRGKSCRANVKCGAENEGDRVNWHADRRVYAQFLQQLPESV